MRHSLARIFRRASSSSATTKPHYVTTPIFYVNAAPHVGHLHSLLLADVLSRYGRLRHPGPFIFATGTDEHGLKIQQVARAQQRDPQDLCDQVSERFRSLATAAGSSHTTFIRTTEPRHAIAVQHLWRELCDRGWIYKGQHSGWYAVSDECFYTESQIEERDGEKVAIESGSRVEWTEEENYKFRLSDMRQKLIEWYERNPKAVHPPTLHASLLESLRQAPLADLSVSRPRSRLSWGITVPDDPAHTIYVWVDALTNYLTVLGYPNKVAAGWPADVQVVGKDIVRFHAIYWPALLLAAGMEPPRTVLSHAHWTMNRLKMSKSRGNVADPFEAIATYTLDGVRWYLMRNGGSLGQDADYSPQEIETQYKQLASQVGNLLGRISSPKLLDRVSATPIAIDCRLSTMLGDLCAKLEDRLDRYEITRACEDVMDVVAEANRHFTAAQPWSATCPPDVLDSCVLLAHDALRLAGIALQPIMPDKTSQLLDRLGVEKESREWDDLQPERDVERFKRRLKKMREAKKKEVLFPPLTTKVVQ